MTAQDRSLYRSHSNTHSYWNQWSSTRVYGLCPKALRQQK